MYSKVYGGSYTCPDCGCTVGVVKMDDTTVIKEFSENFYLNPDCKNGHCTEDERYCVLVKYDDFMENPNYYIDKAFISVLGLDLDYGVSIPSMSDALVKKAILDSSNKKICMADHTKFHKKYMSKIANIDDFDMIITDDKLESDIHVKNIIKAH